MTFGEKIRTARTNLGYSQKELAELTGITYRTIQNYESGSRLPKRRGTYTLLAGALHLAPETLLDETAEFIMRAQEKYGTRAAVQAQELTAQVTALCAGGELQEDDLDAMMKAIQDAYWIAKERNRKYAPKSGSNASTAD